MGYRTGFTCHDSLSDAVDYVYSQQLIMSNSNAPTYTVFKKTSNGSWVGQNINSSNGGLVNEYSAPSLSFPECDPLSDYMDGLTLGFMLFGIYIIVFFLRIVKKQAFMAGD